MEQPDPVLRFDVRGTKKAVNDVLRNNSPAYTVSPGLGKWLGDDANDLSTSPLVPSRLKVGK